MIYLDNAAATALDPRVKNAMDTFLTTCYANPSSPHTAGKAARDAIENARKTIATHLHCRPTELIFVSSGTESINLAIQGLAAAHPEKKHIVTTRIEHKAVLETCKHLQQQGYTITYAKVNSDGVVNEEDLARQLTPHTLLVTIHYTNNEIGTIQNIPALAQIAKDAGAYFHTDACQSGTQNLNVEELGIDMLTLNACKMHGPKGVGVLYVKQGTKIQPLLYGGAQERNQRAGTENITGITGMAAALHIAQTEPQPHIAQLRNKLINDVLNSIPGVLLNGHPEKRAANNANFSFKSIEGEALVAHLDAQNIYVSTGSACTSSSLEPSHVITALGRSYDEAHGTVRLTLSKYTTEEEIMRVVDALKKTILQLRSAAPLRVNP